MCAALLRKLSLFHDSFVSLSSHSLNYFFIVGETFLVDYFLYLPIHSATNHARDRILLTFDIRLNFLASEGVYLRLKS